MLLQNSQKPCRERVSKCEWQLWCVSFAIERVMRRISSSHIHVYASFNSLMCVCVCFVISDEYARLMIQLEH